MNSNVAKIRLLSDSDYLQLMKLVSGLLRSTDGDIVEAMCQAMPMHIELLHSIRDDLK